MARPAAVLDILVNAQTGKASAELKKFERNLKSTERQAGDTDKQIVSSDKNVKSFGGSIGDANQRVLGLKNAIGLVKFPAFIAGAGAAAQAVGALGAGAVGLTSALAPLSGLLAAYPALLGAMGQAAGVKALAGFDKLGGAVGGLNEKLDETTTEFKALSPEAQKFARSLNQAKGPVRDLQAAVQKPLFKGLNEGIDAAMENFPALQKVLKGTAGEMGRLAKEAGELVGSKGFGKDFESIGKNNTQLLGRLGDAGLNFANALRHVMVAAEPLIDFLGKGVVQFSEWIEAEAKAGRESGRMAEFFERTEKVVRQLVSIGGSLASAFMDIGSAARPLGESILKTLVQQAEKLSEWTSSNQGTLKAYFEDAKGPLAEAGKLVKDIVAGFFDLSNQSGLAGFISQIRKDLLPAIIKMTKATTKEFGPIFIDALTEVAKLLTNFVGSSGTLTLFVRGISHVAEVLNRLFESIPELASAASSALAGFSILKLLGLTGASKTAAVTAAATTGKAVGTAAGTAATTSLKSRAAGMASNAFSMGKKLLGVNLALGVVAGFTSEAPNVRSRIQDAFSSITFGILPSWSEESQRDFAAFKASIDKIGESVQTGATGVREGSKQMQDYITNVLDTAENLSPEMREQLNKVIANWRRTGHELRDETNRIRGNIEAFRNTWFKSLGDIMNRTDKNMRDIETSLGTHSRRGRQAISENFDAAIVAINKAMDAGRISTEKGAKAIHSILIKQLRSYGIKDAEAFLRTTEGKASRDTSGTPSPGGKQKGGMVPGYGTGDKVPLHIGGQMAAMVEPGEYVSVANKRATQALMAANDAVPRFAQGGVVPGDTAGLNSGILNFVSALASKFGGSVSSGLRATDTGSLHSTGNAADYTPADWKGASAAVNASGSKLMEGIYNPATMGGTPVSWDSGSKVPSSFWGSEWANHLDHIHLAIGEFTGKIAAGAAAALKLQLPRFTSDVGLGAMVAQGLNNSAAAIEEVIGKRASARMGGMTHGAVPSVKGMFNAAQMAELWLSQGGPRSQSHVAGAVGMAESMGDPNAVGPMTAYGQAKGLWQILGQVVPGDIFDPVVNAKNAVKKYNDAGGWSPWEAYTNGNYQTYMAKGGVVAKLAEGGGLNFGANPVRGKVSWFSDSQTASGTSAATNKGLALNIDPGTDSGWNNAKTRKWLKDAQDFQVTIGSHKAIMPVIDLGPAGSTGRAIDVSQPGVKALGYTTSNFPTDSMGIARRIKSRGGGGGDGSSGGGNGGSGGGLDNPPDPLASPWAQVAASGTTNYDPTASPWAQAFIGNFVPPKIKAMIEAYQGALNLLTPKIAMAEFLSSWGSSEGGSSLGPNEIAEQLFLNQQLLANLEGMVPWLKKGIAHKKTGPKAKQAMRDQLAAFEGNGLDDFGVILNTKKKIDDLMTTEVSTELTEAQVFNKEYLERLLREANLRTTVSQAQYRVFENFAGGFAGGGYIPQGKWGVVGESGPEVVGGPSTVAQMGGEGVSVIVNGDIINTPPGMQPVEVRGAKTIVQQGSRGYGRRPLGGAKGY